jgi:excisionase family DNA binding protein
VRAVVYARVAALDEAETLDLRAQEEALRDVAGRRGWNVVAFESDKGFGARNLERPGLHRLLRRVKEGAVDVVLVSGLDRLTRCVSDLHRLLWLFRESKVSLVSLEERLDSTTEAGALTLDLLERISRWEQVVVAPGAGTQQCPEPVGGPELEWISPDEGDPARAGSEEPVPPSATGIPRERKRAGMLAQGKTAGEMDLPVPHRREGPIAGLHDRGALMTPEQVADRLKISRLTVMDYLRRGLLSGVKVGRLWRVQEQDLEDYLVKSAKG